MTALICPIPVHRQIIRIDGPIALLVAIAGCLLLLDDRLGRVEGAILFAGVCAYTCMNLVLATRSVPPVGEGGAESIVPSQDLKTL